VQGLLRSNQRLGDVPSPGGGTRISEQRTRPHVHLPHGIPGMPTDPVSSITIGVVPSTPWYAASPSRLVATSGLIVAPLAPQVGGTDTAPTRLACPIPAEVAKPGRAPSGLALVSPRRLVGTGVSHLTVNHIGGLEKSDGTNCQVCVAVVWVNGPGEMDAKPFSPRYFSQSGVTAK
jgi:hypothetical protein